MKNQFFLYSLILAIPLAIFAQDDAVVEEAAVEEAVWGEAGTVAGTVRDVTTGGALPEYKVPRLPSVVSLWARVAVYEMCTFTCSYSMPRSSAAINPSDALEPPTSTVPTARDTVPSTPILRSVQVCPPK